MNERDATEQAYRNGYEAGVREFAERLKEKAYLDGTVSIAQELVVDVRDIDDLVEEMTVNYESTKNDKPEIVLKAVEMKNKGYTVKYIADQLGYCERHIYRILKKGR